MFPTAIETAYRVVETRYGGEDREFTIPLGSWRKGGGLAGKHGHVYVYGLDTAGVWLSRQSWPKRVAELKPDFPNLVLMQQADGECTFRVPMTDLARLLPRLGAKTRRRLSKAHLEALERAGRGYRFGSTRL